MQPPALTPRLPQPRTPKKTLWCASALGWGYLSPPLHWLKTRLLTREDTVRSEGHSRRWLGYRGSACCLASSSVCIAGTTMPQGWTGPLPPQPPIPDSATEAGAPSAPPPPSSWSGRPPPPSSWSGRAPATPAARLWGGADTQHLSGRARKSPSRAPPQTRFCPPPRHMGGARLLLSCSFVQGDKQDP